MKKNILRFALVFGILIVHPAVGKEPWDDFSLFGDFPRDRYVCLDSKVPASIYINKKLVGKTPFCGYIERSLFAKVVLKASGYKEAKVPLKKRVSLNLEWWGISSMANISTSSLPSSRDMTFTSEGRWIQYQPGSYYIEMVPLNKKSNELTDDVKDFDRKITDFALKNFYEIKAGNYEYVKAFSALSGMSEEKIGKISGCYSTPEQFSKEVVLREKKIQNYAYKHFHEIKAGKKKNIDDLSFLSLLSPERIKSVVQNHSMPESFAYEFLRSVYDEETTRALSIYEQIRNYGLCYLSSDKNSCHSKLLELSALLRLPPERIEGIKRSHFNEGWNRVDESAFAHEIGKISGFDCRFEAKLEENWGDKYKLQYDK